MYTANDVATAVGPLGTAEFVTRTLRGSSFTLGRVEVISVFDATNGDPVAEYSLKLVAGCFLSIARVVSGSGVPAVSIQLFSNGVVVASRTIESAQYLSSDTSPDIDVNGNGTIEIVVQTTGGAVRVHTVSFGECVSTGLGLSPGTLVRNSDAAEFQTSVLKRQDSGSGTFAARGPAAFDILVVVDGEIRSQGYNENRRPTDLRQTLADDVGAALFLRGARLPPAANGAARAPDAILTWLVGKGTGSEIRVLSVKRD